MNNDNFLVEETDLELAKNVCKNIEDPKIRNRAVANTLAATLSKKYFTEVDVDTESGLHKCSTILNKIDISDIYVKDSYIDVRIYFENNELCVPKAHFEKNILPTAYMFMKLDSSLSGATVTGFVLPESIDQSKESNGYYFVSEDSLISYYDIESHLLQNYTDDVPIDFDTLIFDYLDNKLDEDKDFYKTLLASRYCRESLKNAANVQAILEEFYCDENIAEDFREPKNELESSEDFDLLEASDDESLELNSAEENTLIEEFENNIDITESENLIELDSSEIDDIQALEEVEEFSSEINDEMELSLDTDLDSDEIQAFEEIEESNIDFGLETNNTAEENVVEESTLDAQLTFEDISNETNYEELPQFEEEQKEEISQLPIEDYTEISELTETQLEEALAEDFSTTTTPSMDSIEQGLTEEDLETSLENEEYILEYKEDSEAEAKINAELEPEDNNTQIDNLFNNDDDKQEIFEEKGEEEFTPHTKNNSKVLPMLGALTLIVALGYFGYTKFINSEPIGNETAEIPQTIQQNPPSSVPVEDAMPVESIENIAPIETENEGNAISIPAIEQNLDASILVSNLTVNWEVPAGYVSNSTAKRYFTKIGKIIQLNLKTELLLLSKPPVTNKIMLELEFNKNQNKFGVKGITASSGEQFIDDLIVQTVKNVLDINLKTNMSTFSNIAGNPVLIIRL